MNCAFLGNGSRTLVTLDNGSHDSLFAYRKRCRRGIRISVRRRLEVPGKQLVDAAVRIACAYGFENGLEPGVAREAILRRRLYWRGDMSPWDDPFVESCPSASHSCRVSDGQTVLGRHQQRFWYGA